MMYCSTTHADIQRSRRSLIDVNRILQQLENVSYLSHAVEVYFDLTNPEIAAFALPKCRLL